MDDGYTSWRGGVTNNKNGTYTVNYRIDSQKALLNSLSPLEIYVKIDDGTMFNNETVKSKREHRFWAPSGPIDLFL